MERRRTRNCDFISLDSVPLQGRWQIWALRRRDPYMNSPISLPSLHSLSCPAPYSSFLRTLNPVSLPLSWETSSLCPSTQHLFLIPSWYLLANSNLYRLHWCWVFPRAQLCQLWKTKFSLVGEEGVGGKSVWPSVSSPLL